MGLGHKTAVITGAASGIGKEIARRFVAEGGSDGPNLRRMRVFARAKCSGFARDPSK
jgi:NAD(P)-dependent dehydrogenase (short-subunit alcohol dehydrogenase family)